MKHNENTVDRMLRAGLAVAAGAVAFWVGATSLGGVLLLVVALVLLVTAVVGFCPLYAVLGVSTCPVRSTHTASDTAAGHGARTAR